MSPVLHIRELRPGDPARTVVLLHGLTDSGKCWPDAVRRWEPHGWRVLAPDLRGHGSSPRWDDDTLARRPGLVMTEDVVDLVEEEAEPDRSVVLVGHSMGAAVAVAVAATVPRLVRGVVAEDPPWPLPPITAPDPIRARAYLAGHAEDVRRDHSRRVADQRAATPSWPEEELEPWSCAKEQADVRLLRTGDILPPTPWPDLVSVLAASGVPLLVVTGERDVRVPAASEVEARARGAWVVRISGAGHCVRRDRAEDYHAAVDPFLASLLP